MPPSQIGIDNEQQTLGNQALEILEEVPVIKINETQTSTQILCSEIEKEESLIH